MKRLFLLTVSVLCAFSVSAQEQGVLDAFTGSLASGEVSFKYSFEVKGDIPLKGNGTASLAGDRYRVFGNGMEIWCDGTTRWIIDRSAREAYIEAVETESADYVSNPATLLSGLSRAFETVDVSDVTLSGKKLKAVRMKPAVEDTGLESVTLYLADAVPARVGITVEDGTETLFRISNYAVHEKSDAVYSFDIASLGSEYVVTDLR